MRAPARSRTVKIPARKKVSADSPGSPFRSALKSRVHRAWAGAVNSATPTAPAALPSRPASPAHLCQGHAATGPSPVSGNNHHHQRRNEGGIGGCGVAEPLRLEYIPNRQASAGGRPKQPCRRCQVPPLLAVDQRQAGKRQDMRSALNHCGAISASASLISTKVAPHNITTANISRCASRLREILGDALSVMGDSIGQCGCWSCRRGPALCLWLGQREQQQKNAAKAQVASRRIEPLLQGMHASASAAAAQTTASTPSDSGMFASVEAVLK